MGGEEILMNTGVDSQTVTAKVNFVNGSSSVNVSKSQNQGFLAPASYLNNINGTQMEFLDNSSSATSICVPQNEFLLQHQNTNQLSTTLQQDPLRDTIHDDPRTEVPFGVNIDNHLGMPSMILDPLTAKGMVGPNKDFENSLSPEGMIQPELSSSMVSQSFGVPDMAFNPIDDSTLLNTDVWAPPAQQFQRRTYTKVRYYKTTHNFLSTYIASFPISYFFKS